MSKKKKNEMKLSICFQQVFFFHQSTFSCGLPGSHFKLHIAQLFGPICMVASSHQGGFAPPKYLVFNADLKIDFGSQKAQTTLVSLNQSLRWLTSLLDSMGLLESTSGHSHLMRPWCCPNDLAPDFVLLVTSQLSPTHLPFPTFPLK